MAYPTKIATCCYCGARAALVMPKKGRQELSCSRCAAPLHNLKQMPVVVAKAAKQERPKAVDHRKPAKVTKHKYAKPKKRCKSRFSAFKDMIEDAVDFVEDIFD